MTDTAIAQKTITDCYNLLKLVMEQALQQGSFKKIDDVQAIAQALAIIPQLDNRIQELIAHINLLESKLEKYEPPVD